MDMINDNMNISHLMVHVRQEEEIRVKRKSLVAKRESLLMVFLRRVGFISKTNLDLRRHLIIKFLPNFPRLVLIECKTLCLKKVDVLANQARSKIVESVARSIMVIALLGLTFSLGVASVFTILGIA